MPIHLYVVIASNPTHETAPFLLQFITLLKLQHILWEYLYTLKQEFPLRVFICLLGHCFFQVLAIYIDLNALFKFYSCS